MDEIIDNHFFETKFDSFDQNCNTFYRMTQLTILVEVQYACLLHNDSFIVFSKKRPLLWFFLNELAYVNIVLRVENKGLFDHKWKRMCEERVSKEELVRLRRAFAIFDVDGDGTITTEVSQKAWLLKQ